MASVFLTIPDGANRIAYYDRWLYITNSQRIIQYDLNGNVINPNYLQGTNPFVIISNYLYRSEGTSRITRYTINSDGTLNINSKNEMFFADYLNNTDVSTERLYSYQNYIILSTGSSTLIGIITVDPITGDYVRYNTLVPFGGSTHPPDIVFGYKNYIYVKSIINKYTKYNLTTSTFDSTVFTISKPITQYSLYGSNIYGNAWNGSAAQMVVFDLDFNFLYDYVISPRSLYDSVIIDNNIYALTHGAEVVRVTLPQTYEYSKININYSGIVNGNSVSRSVFEGYYKYQVSNKTIQEFYSLTDMSTNLIIPSTDSFASGALTLLGKSKCNLVTSDGIDTSSNNAGIFVKGLPFVNALFKTNPYILINSNGLVMFDNYGQVNANVLATSYFANKYVISNGNVYSNKNNSFFSFGNYTFNYTTVTALPTVSVPLPVDYTFFNSIKQIKYNAKYNGAVLLDSYFVFYLDSSNNYHMCAQYPTTTNKNVLLFSDSACDNFPNTGNFGNTLGTVNPDPTVTTIVAVSGNAATATVTTSTVSATGTPTVTTTVTATGTVARVNLNALNSNICFSEGSIVSTDQGDVEIQHIDIHYHTIRNNKIIALTETQSVDDYLVKIKKNAFGNVPTQDTETTGNHMIFNGLSMVRAKTLINETTIEKIPYRGLPLYNILLQHHDLMSVNGLVCETLNPENPIAKYYIMMSEHPEHKIEMENMWRKQTQEIIHSF